MKKVPSTIVPIVAIDRKSPDALYKQIYDAYRSAIAERRLRSGQRIPSTRVLASELGLSRFPVLNAYSQLLAEGYFESRVGSGTIVSTSLPQQFAPGRQMPRRPAGSSDGRSILRGERPVSRRSSNFAHLDPTPWTQGWGAFNVGEVAFDQFPLQIWSQLVARHCRKMGARSFLYGDSLGSARFREIIASYLRTSRSLQCEASQVMITAGSQQALEITARVLLDPGSQVWVENPCYRLSRESLVLAGCSLVPVPVDEEGLDVSAGIKRCRKARAALVTPSHQFPLGVTMSASRRLQLLDWAQSSGSWIIEDDYDSEFRYESMPIASLQGLDANARVIYIGTFSKVLFPSLRLGYLVIPADLVDRFAAVRRTMDISPSSFFQDVVADFMSEGHFARHIRRMGVLYAERRRTLVQSLAQEVGSFIEVLGSEAGMHLAVALPNSYRDQEIAERGARQNLWIWPLSRNYLSESRSGLVLGFGSSAPAEIPRAVGRLRDLLASNRER